MKPTSPSDNKNIEIIDLDSDPRVFRPTDALQFVIERIGFEKVMNGTVRHMGAKLLIRRPFKINLNTFKKVDEDLYLNRKGTAVDKFRTITILNSVHRLNLAIRLTSDAPTKASKAPKSVRATNTTRAPRKSKTADLPELDTSRHQEPLNISPATPEESYCGWGGLFEMSGD